MKATETRSRRGFAVLCAVASMIVTAAAQTPQGPQPIASGFGAGAYRPGPGITNPTLVKVVQPVYPAAAKTAGLEGDVELEAVVKDNGTVGDVRVSKSLDAVMGCDDAAVAAAKQWLFTPAKMNDKAVPALVALIVSFKLHGDGDLNSPAATQGKLQIGQIVSEGFGKGATVQNSPGVRNPELIRSKEPQYTADAMRAKLQGLVELQAVIMPDGTVGEVRITKSLDAVTGLDDEAVKAVKQWQFKPGELNGRPVPVIVTLNLTFRLH